VTGGAEASHLVIDPFQAPAYDNVGRDALNAAGLAAQTTFRSASAGRRVGGLIPLVARVQPHWKERVPAMSAHEECLEPVLPGRRNP
jgi:hypothetical protein